MAVLPPQRKLELVGRFARSLAHDVRNSLNVMSLHLQLIADRTKSGRAPSVEDMERAEKSLRDQVGKIDRLVTRFGRFASPAPEEAEEDLGETVLLAVGLCEMQARRARIVFETQASPGVRTEVPAETVEDLLADLLCRLCDLPELAGTKVRVILEAGGRLQLEAQVAWPRAFTASAQGFAKRAGLDAEVGERQLAFAVGASGRSR